MRVVTWNVNGITTMEDMFRSSDFNQDISNWNVTNVTNMKGMFSAHNSTDGTTKFNQDIRGWKGKINSGFYRKNEKKNDNFIEKRVNQNIILDITDKNR